MKKINPLMTQIVKRKGHTKWKKTQSYKWVFSKYCSKGKIK